jgi:hypothetical protein
MTGSYGTGPVANRREMCISCYKPETTTAMVVHGDIDWLAAVLNNYAMVPMKEAMDTAEEIYRDHEATPQSINTNIIRLCRACAKKTGVPVHDMKVIEQGGALRAVIQPEGT